MKGSWCCKTKIKIVNKLPKDKKIDSKTTLSYDEQFEVPRFEIKFDGFYETTIRIWPDRLLQKEAIEETRKIYMEWNRHFLKKMIKIIACPCHREQIEI